MNKAALVAAALLGAACPLAAVAQEPAAPAAESVAWEKWQAGNEVSNVASLQRGFRNFMNYCAGCHSMKYVRYSRVATDLKIPIPMLKADLLPDGAAPEDYIHASLKPQDGVAWFGKEPPDLSLIARSLGVDKSYRFLKTFYLDPSRPTRTNNLVLDAAAMPAVLSDLEGVKQAVFRNVDVTVDGKSTSTKQFDHFVTVVPGRMSGPEFDLFLRDTVNFLDYAGEPAQVDRRSLGVWVVLFLLVFTWLAWLLKKEYWKDVH
ncbi:MAG TPA: cytochrome c1 [Steroidobacteraceae bacterium]|nr:cytochrome c1 [Steroidobacteraceae bacterium]